jgi:phospholipid/cholesterol/gamma-HCH transport system substrate-binding protein
MKFKIRFASQIVGVFVIVAVLFLSGAFILMGLNQRWFAKNYYFTSRFSSGKGLGVGMPISFKGFEIGKITKLTLTDDNTVEIHFFIQDTFYPKVFENSVLQLITNPLGLGGGLVFHQGKEPTEPIKEFSYIPSLDLGDGRVLIKRGLVDISKDDDAITRLLGEVEPILLNVNLLLLSLNELLDSVNSALAGTSTEPLGTMVKEAEKIVRNLNSTTRTVSGSIGDTMTQANDLLGNLNEITANLEATTAALRDPQGLVKKLLDPKGSISTFLDDENRLFDQVEGILKGVNESLNQVNEFSSFINTTRPQLLGILEESQQAIKQGQDVLLGLKNNPLLRGGIPDKLPTPTTQAGYRDEAF